MSKKEKKKKQYEDDDGRTIAGMNVEGMPWYVNKPDTDKASATPEGQDNSPPKLSGSEQRAMLRGVLGATLLIGSVFVIVFAAFILFCVYVWFR